ncbi:hypothetical protein CDO73_07760 [Saccharibacillus sp. O23]|uniref:DUF3349 domain-containing protein n=1 Tax=Saccharibacillus sp. O23 TaxID=2009338 RepID=UPI000B4E6E1E|nr:DUF3349 domain-containing protein [Saccharibacillus sp. O23]OWR31288.1 hypothetical protein CDO73_07760 [Saccharibacillus sp. O23]
MTNPERNNRPAAAHVPQEARYPRCYAVKIERAPEKSVAQHVMALKRLHPPLTKLTNAELLDRFENSDEWIFEGLLKNEAEALVRRVEEKGFRASLSNFDDSRLPYALRGIYRMLGKAYPFGIPESEYAAVILVLYKQLSDRNLAEILSLHTGTEAASVLNDIYKSATISRPSDELFYSVREKLEAQGLDRLTEEADLSEFEEMWTTDKHQYALYEIESNRYAIMRMETPAMVLIEEEHIAEQVIQRMLDHGCTILDKNWMEWD